MEWISPNLLGEMAFIWKVVVDELRGWIITMSFTMDNYFLNLVDEFRGPNSFK